MANGPKQPASGGGNPANRFGWGAPGEEDSLIITPPKKKAPAAPPAPAPAPAKKAPAKKAPAAPSKGGNKNMPMPKGMPKKGGM